MMGCGGSSRWRGCRVYLCIGGALAAQVCNDVTYAVGYAMCT